jgi:hypothetical protein
MILFLDTEFTDFNNRDLISIAAVSEDGAHEFYAEITDYLKPWQTEFVRTTVVPLLDNATHGLPYKQAAAAFVDWLNELPESITIVIDYHGDMMLTLGMFAAKRPNRDREPAWVFFNPALTDRLEEVGVSAEQSWDALDNVDKYVREYFETDPRQHHALVDARGARYAWVKILGDYKND